MSDQSWVECLLAAGVDGPALTNTVTATSLLGVAAGQVKLVIGAGVLNKIGKRMRVTAAGRISTLTAAPGTLTLDVRLGGVIIANGGAMALNINAKTNVPWTLAWDLTLRAIGGGTTANWMHQGVWTSEAVIGSPLPSAGGSGSLLLPAAAPAPGTGFDSTAAQTLDLFGTWSIANAANSITVHQFSVDLLN